MYPSAQDIPLIYVSHAQDEVARLADHLVLLEQGRAIASGPIGETLARLDLSLAQGDDAGVVFEGRVVGHDPHYGLLDLRLPGSSEPLLRITHAAQVMGSTLRVKVQARDVSLALAADSASSILNRLPVRVRESCPAANPAHVLVSLDAGGNALLARITRFSADQLGLHTGQILFAQIKSVALLG